MHKPVGRVSAKFVAEKARERQGLTNIIPVVSGTVEFPVPLFICACPCQCNNGTLCPSPSFPTWEVGVMFCLCVCILAKIAY